MNTKDKPNIEIREKFGKRIKQLRQEMGLSQEELGFRTNIHRTYIGSIERGEQNVSLDNIAKLSKIFNLTLEELFHSV